jgi:hypothetical protein
MKGCRFCPGPTTDHCQKFTETGSTSRRNASVKPLDEAVDATIGGPRALALGAFAGRQRARVLERGAATHAPGSRRPARSSRSGGVRGRARARTRPCRRRTGSRSGGNAWRASDFGDPHGVVDRERLPRRERSRSEPPSRRPARDRAACASGSTSAAPAGWRIWSAARTCLTVSSEQVVELSRLIQAARASGLTGADLRVAVDTAAAITTTRRPAARCCRPSSPARSEPRHPPATAGNMSRWRTLELLVRRCSDITATAADGPFVCAVTGSGLRAMTPVDPKMRTA